MKIYRFKISFREDPEVYRIIDIEGSQTFRDFHKIILKSIDFKDGELASFILNSESPDERVEISLSDLQNQDEGGLLMDMVRIMDIISDSNNEILYIYDFLNLWTFQVKYLKSLNKKSNSKYPAVIEVVGQTLKQDDTEMNMNYDLSDEDIRLMRDLKLQNEDMFIGEDYDYNEDFDEDEDEF